MPSEEKKSWAKLRVGLMAVAALIIFAVLVFVLTSSRGLFKSYTNPTCSLTWTIQPPLRPARRCG